MSRASPITTRAAPRRRNIAPRRNQSRVRVHRTGKSSTKFGLEEWTAPAPAAETTAIHPEGAPLSLEYSAAFSTATAERVFGTRRCASANPFGVTPAARPRLLMSQEIVADRVSSQHLERMNHLAALQRENRGGESCIIPDVAAVSDDGRQIVP